MSRRVRLALAIGAVAATGLATILGGSAVGNQASSTCDGKEAIVGIDVEAVYGTSAADYVVLGENTPFYGGGGVDTVCGLDGSVEAVVHTEPGEPDSMPAQPHTVPNLTTLEEMDAGAR
jgi:hypothetical protein